MSRLTDGLERLDWIVRTKDPKDSRQKLVTPTPKVLDTAEHCATIARAVLEAWHSNLAHAREVLNAAITGKPYPVTAAISLASNRNLRL